MKLPLSSLLYYDLSTIKHGDIKKGFKEYRLLLSAFIEAIEAFESGELEKFDSLVGENACQIRAIRIALIHANNTLNTQSKDVAFKVREEISILLDTKINSLASGKLNLREIFELHSLEIFLTEDEIFLLKSFILSEAKESIDAEETSAYVSTKLKCAPYKIQKFASDVSCNFAGKLTNRLRQLLAQSSVEFVQQAAFNQQDSALVEILSDDSLYYHNTLACLPMFWTYKTLLKLAKTNEIPLIVHVKLINKEKDNHVIADEKHYFFKPMQDSKGHWHYKLTAPTQEDLTKAACVVEGVADCSESVSWDQKTLTNSIVNVILAGAADHRQYPNFNPSFKVKGLEYFYFKSMALNQGFSLQNPSSFFIHHVYATQVNTKFANVRFNDVSTTSNFLAHAIA